MASGYTAHYQLNQWQPEDNFLRAEFNTDNQRLEAALSGLEARTALLEHQVAPMQHNLYNLMLQNDYDGKSTAFKQALLFDGLQDAARIGGTTPGASYRPDEKRVRVMKTGAGTINTGFSVAVGESTPIQNDGDKCAWVGSTAPFYRDSPFTLTGFGRLTSVTMRICGIGNTVTANVSIVDGENVVATSSNTFTITSTTFAEFTFTFPGGVLLSPKQYALRVTNANQTYYLRVSYGSVDGFGAVYQITPINYTTGAFTCVQADLGEDYRGATAWVRHVGGSVAMALRAGSGAYLAMTRQGARQTATLGGDACTETTFQMARAPASPNRLVTLQIALDASQGECAVCDYGVVFY